MLRTADCKFWRPQQPPVQIKMKKKKNTELMPLLLYCKHIIIVLCNVLLRIKRSLPLGRYALITSLIRFSFSFQGSKLFFFEQLLLTQSIPDTMCNTNLQIYIFSSSLFCFFANNEERNVFLAELVIELGRHRHYVNAGARVIHFLSFYTHRPVTSSASTFLARLFPPILLPCNTFFFLLCIGNIFFFAGYWSPSSSAAERR